MKVIELINRVRISNMVSDLLKSNCGVPQGTVLDLLLFLTYINGNDACNSISEGMITSYTDDTVLLCSDLIRTQLFIMLNNTQISN